MIQAPATDIKALAGKFREADDHFATIVVGCGDAGIDAAMAAARSGGRVLLVDEHPIPGSLMRIDVPYLFGGRFTAAVDRPARLMEQIVQASPRLIDVLDCGVELQLGASIWGAFRSDDAGRVLERPLLGVVEGDMVRMLGFDRLVIATGARDLILPFPGADQPGVIGATALRLLISKYDAFAGRRILVLGSGRHAQETAQFALDHGLAVAGLVEVRPQPLEDGDLLRSLVRRGVRLFPSHCIGSVRAGIDGVEQAVLGDLAIGTSIAVDCDTVCFAIDHVPNVELATLLDCDMVFDAARGGHVPVVNADGVTSIATISLAGDCAGIDSTGLDYRQDWMRALRIATDSGAPACLCETVSRAELIDVRPPAYLDWPNWPGGRMLEQFAQSGTIHPDRLKRLTRAGMGLCQGRRCRDATALQLSLQTGTPLADIPVATLRTPIRPLPLSTLATAHEPSELTDNWVAWFGIAGQWSTPSELATALPGRDEDQSI